MQRTGSGADSKKQPQGTGGTTGRSRVRTREREEEREGGEASTDGAVSTLDAQRETHDPVERETTDNEITSTCPECRGDVIADDEHAERVCNNCGLVIKTGEIDRGPEWRAFDAAERGEKSRVGSPSTMLQHDKGLSTQISWKNRDGYGNTLSARRRQQMNRLRKRDEWFRTRDPRQRTLKQALGEIQRMGSALGCDEDVREMAGVIFRRAADERLLLGRSIEGVATASMYAACRQAGIPRTPNEVATVSRTDQLSIERAYRSIVTTLGLAVKATAAESYVPQFVSKIDFENPNKVETTALEILEAGREDNLHSGRSPSGLAGASIYGAALANDEQVTQKAISNAADTTTVTIRTHYRELLHAAGYSDPDTESAAPCETVE